MPFCGGLISDHACLDGAEMIESQHIVHSLCETKVRCAVLGWLNRIARPLCRIRCSEVNCEQFVHLIESK